MSAEPSPRKNLRSRAKASGGKAKIWCVPTWVKPLTITQASVPITPAQSTQEILLTARMPRISSKTDNSTRAIARQLMPLIAMRLPQNVPAAPCDSSDGKRYAAYCETPTAPEAIESGALNEICQTNKNAKRRPQREGP